jgi:hypothetical protein
MVAAGALAGFGGSTVSVTPADMAMAGEGGSIGMVEGGVELLLLPGSKVGPGTADTLVDALADTLVLLTVAAGSLELPLPQPASIVTPARAIPITGIFILIDLLSPQCQES